MDGGEVDDPVRKHAAILEENASTFRSMTSLDVDEARELYRRARSEAARQSRAQRSGQAGGRAGAGRGGAPAAIAPAATAGGGGDDDGEPGFMPYERFLMAVALARNTDSLLVDYIFRAPKGAAQAALDEALPILMGFRDMPRRFARRLVPFGYRMPPLPKKWEGSGDLLEYMDSGSGHAGADDGDAARRGSP